VQIKTTTVGSGKVSLLGQQSGVAADGEENKRLLRQHLAAPHSALLHALLPCVHPQQEPPSIPGISRVITVQAETQAQLRS